MSAVRIAMTVEVDLAAWAAEYGMTSHEGRAALRSTAREAMRNYLEDNGFACEVRP